MKIDNKYIKALKIGYQVAIITLDAIRQYRRIKAVSGTPEEENAQIILAINERLPRIRAARTNAINNWKKSTKDHE